MPIRRQVKLSTASIVPGTRLDLNPFAQRPGTARLLQNWLPERTRVIRKAFSPNFTSKLSSASGAVWDIVDFNFHRASAPERQLLIFRADGKVYKRIPGGEIEIFNSAGNAVLNYRPGIAQIGNRLFWADKSNAYVYDGRGIRRWGIPRETTTLATPTVVAGAGFTAASGVSASITWVVLDESGNRVHESSRSGISAYSAALSNQRARISVAALTAPAGATHWSGYMSETNGSSRRRRVNTTLITTTTLDVTAFPAGTAALEPTLNDPPTASTVMGQWRHRIAMRQENDPRAWWFTAFGEVRATNAGSAEESVCGRDSSSVSALVNQFLLPNRSTRLILEHGNQLLNFSETDGYAVVGTGGILDNIGTRGLSNEHFIDEGAAGGRAGVSTPFGFIWMTAGRKVNLWPGDRSVLDLGQAIQSQLDTIPEADLEDVQFFWWDGNGRKWITVCAKCSDADDLTGAPAYRALICDFSQPSEAERPGEWFEWNDNTYTVLKDYRDGDQRFLVGGDASGNVYQLDVIPNPSHLNRSMILGKTYLGSTVQNNPACTLRTGLMAPNDDKEAAGLYLSHVRGTQESPSTTLGTNPTLAMALDTINPDTPPAISMTSDTAKASGEFITWLKPESGGVEGGAYGKQFQFQASYAAGASNNGEADGRTTLALDALYKLGFSWQVQNVDISE